MGKSRVLASRGRVLEMTVCLMAEGRGGLACGAHAANGWVRGFLAFFALAMGVVDETAARKRESDLWMAGVRLNLGRAFPIFDLVLRGVPVSVKSGTGLTDVTVKWETVRAMVASGAPLWILQVRGDADHIPAGFRGEVAPARNVEGRWVNLTPVLARLGDEVWANPGQEREGRAAFVRQDRKWLRLSVDMGSLTAADFHTSWSADFLSVDLPTEVKWESVDARVVATANEVEVFDSGRVTVNGEDTAPLRKGETAFLTALLTANGEPVMPPNRQTVSTLKRALGDAGGRVVSVRGKGQRWDG